MKTLKLLLLLILFQLAAVSQNLWNPLGTGLSHSFGSPKSQAFTVWNNKLIVGGAFTSAGGNITNNIAMWDGSSWSTFPNGLQVGNANIGGCTDIYGNVNALAVYQGSLIAAGGFGASGTNTLNGIAVWNGTSWVSITNKLKNGSSTPNIFSLIVYNNKLIAGGMFDTINNIVAKNIAQWDGTSWSPLGSGIPYFANGINRINSLEIFNNELCAGGSFTTTVSSQTAYNIVKWNGTAWSKLGNGIPICTYGGSGLPCYWGGVSCLKSYLGGLYAGNCVTGVSKWDGTSWSTVGGGLPAFNDVYAMTIFDNKLIITGEFYQVGLNNNCGSIMAWDGTNWIFVGSDGLNVLHGFNNNGSIYATTTYSNNLYIGGLFNGSTINTNMVSLYSVARFSQSSIIGITEHNASTFKVSIFPSPTNGVFTISLDKSDCTIEITDPLGKPVLKEKLVEKNNSFYLGDQPAGIYFYTLTSPNGQVSSGKLLIE